MKGISMHRTKHRLISTITALLAITTSQAMCEASTEPYAGRCFDLQGTATGLQVGDVNGDSRSDLVICTVLPSQIVLIARTSQDWASPAIQSVPGNPTTISLGDIDGDGIKDAVVPGGSAASFSVIRSSQSGFLPPVTYALSHQVRTTAIGDMNADGALDVIVHTQQYSDGTGQTSIHIYLNSGDGSLVSYAVHPLEINNVTVACADIDSDGIIDVIYGSLLAHLGLNVRKGTGVGTLGPRINIATLSVYGIDAADVDDDNRTDLILRQDNSTAVMLNSASGLGTIVTAFMVPCEDYAFIDLNRDGRKDIVAAPVASVLTSLGYYIQGQGNTYVQANLGAGNYYKPQGLGAGDFDGDFMPEIVVVAKDKAIVLPGNEAPPVGSGSTVTLFPGNGFRAQECQDVNNDTIPDVVTIRFDLSANTCVVDVALGTEDGGLGTVISSWGPTDVEDFQVADVNMDGHMDLVTACGSTGSITIMQGDGAGVFTVSSQLAGITTAEKVAVGDCNGDGLPDIVASRDASSVLYRFTNLGSGQFGPPSSYNTGPNSITDVVLADMNGDGPVDILAVKFSNGKAYVLLNDGAGSFSAAVGYICGYHPQHLCVVDCIPGGMPEVIVGGGSSTEPVLNVLGNDGTGVLAIIQSLTTSSEPSDITAADCNLDGIQDVVVGNALDSISVYLGGQQSVSQTGAQYYAHYGSVKEVSTGDLDQNGQDDIVVGLDGFSAHVGSSQGVLATTLYNKEEPDGRVLLGTNRLPLRGVIVQLLRPVDASLVELALTEADGSYRFSSAVSNGSYIVKAEVITGLTGCVNYPSYDPDKRWQFQSGSPVIPIPEIVVPDPVVLQWGWKGGGGAEGTWAALRSYLEEDPGENEDKKSNKLPGFLCYENEMTTVDASSTDVYEDYCTTFSQFVDDISLQPYLKLTDHAKLEFTLVGHSMGGLIIRGALTMQNAPVARRVITLDSPHGGSTLAVLPSYTGALAEQPLNGTRTVFCEPAQPYLEGWNAAHREVGFGSKRAWLLYSCTNDKIVRPDPSAFGTGRLYMNGHPDDACPEQWVTGANTSVADSHSGVHDNPTRLREVAQYLAYGKKPPSSPGPESDSTPGPAESPSKVFGDLAAAAGGVSASEFYNDDAAALSVTVVLVGLGGQFALLGVNGSPITVGNVETSAMAPDVSVMTFDVTQPPVGPITTQLTAGSSENANAEYLITFANGKTIHADVYPLAITANQAVRVRSVLTDSAGVPVGGLAIATASILSPGGAFLALNMYDDGLHGDYASGDHFYGVVIPGPFTVDAGRYAVTLRTTALANGVRVDRMSQCQFVCGTSGVATLAAPLHAALDEDGDALIDTLRFSTSITAAIPGAYRAVAQVRDPMGAVLSNVGVSVQADQPNIPYAVFLDVEGADLVGHGIDGPYELSTVSLFREDLGTVVATVPGVWTPAYTLDSLERPEPPRVYGLVPDSGSILGGNNVTLRGQGFLGATEVIIDGTVVLPDVIDDSVMIITMPTASVPPPYPAAVDIRVNTPWGYVERNNAYWYTAL